MRFWAAMAAGVALSVQAAPERLVVCVGVHSEDPDHPDTPDFLADHDGYVAYRAGLLRFAGLMQSNRLPWSLQSDWNFLLGVRQYEIVAPESTWRMATKCATTTPPTWARSTWLPRPTRCPLLPIRARMPLTPR